MSKQGSTVCIHGDDPYYCKENVVTREKALAEAAWNYLVKDHPWVAKDEYYKKNPHKSMTYKAAIWGATWEAQRSAVLLEALEKMAADAREAINRAKQLNWPQAMEYQAALEFVCSSLERDARAALLDYAGEKKE